jgi:cysteinyl-tRNA synthetase
LCSEAHNSCDHWVNHWIHTGHLYIDGLKMSKSLKNFISIEDYLSGKWLLPEADGNLKTSPASRRDAADDLRIFFLQHKYHSSLHFSKDRIDEAALWRTKVCNAMGLIRSVVGDDHRKPTALNTRAKRMHAAGFELAGQLQACQAAVDAALRDDFDTPRALQLLMGLCSKANVYAAEVLADESVSVAPLPDVQQYVTSTLQMFGLSFPNALSVSYLVASHLFYVPYITSCHVLTLKLKELNRFVLVGVYLSGVNG